MKLRPCIAMLDIGRCALHRFALKFLPNSLLQARSNLLGGLALAATFLCFSQYSKADVLELKNGTILNGRYIGGTASTVRFEALGSTQVVPTTSIVALTFTSTGSAPAAPATSAPPASQPASAAPVPAPAAPAAATAPRKVTLPAGTMLLVRMKDSISSRNRPGTPFTTKIEYDLVVNGTKVVPAGSVIYGKILSSSQARRAFGQSTLDLRLTQIVAGGAPVPISTSGFKEAGERSIKDAARGAAAGAAIGAIVDGGDGAGKGAAIGATVGMMKRGETITIPPGALIEFNLSQPCTLTVGG